MSKPIRECILNDPRMILSEFTSLDKEIIRSSLFIAAKQIMCKYGYLEINKEGLDKYTIEEVFKRMPNETKIMFFAVNNSGVLIEIEKRLREEKDREFDLVSAELLGCQIQIIELQTKLKEK